MKKSELKTGMLIVTRRGKRALVLLGTSQGDCLAGNDDPYRAHQTWLPLSCYTEQLTYSDDGSRDESDITEVWSYSCNMLGASISTRDRSLVWRREDVKQAAVKLNSNYTAIMNSSSTDVTVGCQTIPIDVVRRLVAEYDQLQSK
jgi:hypothetical protein